MSGRLEVVKASGLVTVQDAGRPGNMHLGIPPGGPFVFERLARVVGKDGRIGERGHVRNATGSWDTSIRSVNDLIEDMVQPTAEVARVIGAVAKGDLSQKMMVEIDGRALRGEFLRIGDLRGLIHLHARAAHDLLRHQLGHALDADLHAVDGPRAMSYGIG